MNPLIVFRNHYEFTIYFANSLWIHSLSVSRIYLESTIFFDTTMNSLWNYYEITMKSIWIHYLFRYFTRNSSFFSRIHYIFREFPINLRSASPFFYEFTICFANSPWIHYEFTIFFAMSLGNHQRSRKFIMDTLSTLRIPLESGNS